MGKDYAMRRIIAKAFEVLNKKEKRWIIPLVIMMLIGAALQSLGVAVIIPLVSSLIDGTSVDSGVTGIFHSIFHTQDNTEFLVSMIILLIVVFVVKNIFLLSETFAQHSFTAKIRRRVQNRLLHYYLERPYSWFLDKDSGAILRTITVDSDYYISLMNHILDFFTLVIEMAVLVIVVFLINPNITIILAIVLCVEYFIVIKFMRPVMRKYGKRYRESLARGNSQIVELMRGIKYVKASGKENWFEERYDKEVKDLTRSKMMERALQQAPGRFIEAVTIAAVLLYILFRVNTGEDVSALVPVLSAFVLAAAKLLPSVSSVSNAISYAGYYEGSLDNVLEIDRTLKKEEDTVLSEEPIVFSKQICFEDICYSYPGNNKRVLDKASIIIPKNHSIGIVGPSGEGKTTLADVILGLLEFQSGRVYVDGKDIDISSVQWKKMFAYIPQQVFVLSGTILDNIVFGQEPDNVNINKVWDALRSAQLEGFVRSLDDGLNTPAGEAGIRLSGGQIQRLGIARAIYSDAPVLIFDEATSALDYDTEAALLDAITGLHGKKTMLVIAHRTETIKTCDTVYRIEKGKAVNDNK